MTRYAENTSVSVEKSRAEIERTLQRYGAEKFVSGWDQTTATIGFVFRGRAFKLSLELPDKADFRLTPAGKYERHPDDALRAWEKACRENWRALCLLVKAKLVAVEQGVATLENEFLAYTCLPSGQTVSDWLQPQIERAIETKRMPVALLPGE
ncbi:MAG: hypothetical protein A2Y76_01540 [Planctomycetes bacterium RBG_13_60_9]|nr:MAG: hypothetical protein A2Y76_01540 [Planctomycetes bacterium RBG_13_60_9]